MPQQLLAKQRSLVGVKGAVGLQLGGKAVGGTGLSTVQIVQGGSQKQMSHVTVQQIQQVFKQVPQTIQHITQVMLEVMSNAFFYIQHIMTTI